MWTQRHRTRHETRLKDVVARMGLDTIASVLERADPPGSREATPARLVLARRQRRRCGRHRAPRLAMVDTQGVKCIGVRGPRGDDGAKKLVGRKRVALVDAGGHILALAVVPANVRSLPSGLTRGIATRCRRWMRAR